MRFFRSSPAQPDPRDGYEEENDAVLALWRQSRDHLGGGELELGYAEGIEAADRWDRLITLPGRSDVAVWLHLSQCLSVLSALARVMGRRVEAVEHGEEAVEISRELMERFPGQGGTEFGNALHQVAISYQEVEQYHDMVAAATELVEVRGRVLASEHQPSDEVEYAKVLLVLAIALDRTGNTQHAVDALVRSVEIGADMGPIGETVLDKSLHLLTQMNEKSPGILAGREIHVHLGNGSHGPETDNDRLRSEAAAGDVAAMGELGLLLKQQGNLQDAEVWLTRAANAGNPSAMNNLGNLCERLRDLERAMLWWERAATAGVPNAQCTLALQYASAGRSGEARAFYLEAKASGDPAVAVQLSMLEAMLNQ